MDFELNEQQKMVRNLTRDFLEREVVPIIKDSEREGRIPRTIIENLASLGLLGGMVNEEYGGMGLDYISHALIGEEFGRVWWSLCITVPIVQTALIELTIQNWGSEEQKRRYLPRLVNGELLGTFATVEPNAGSDAAAIEASAVLDQGQWVLNGNKIWITNGTIADIALITARTAPNEKGEGITLFLIEKDAPGFASKRITHTTGLRAASEAELSLTDCRIPENNIIGEIGQGLHIALASIDNARFTIAAACVGTAQGCIDACVQYSRERKQFGKSIASFQLVQETITNMIVETEAARYLVYRAGDLKNKGLATPRETSIAKYYASEVALRAATNAVRLHGAYGYCDDYPVERYLRDIMGPIVFGGTAEIQKLIIARDALGIGAFI